MDTTGYWTLDTGHSQRLGVIYSIVFHLLVVGLLFLIRFTQVDIPVRDYIEVIAIERVEPLRQNIASASALPRVEQNIPANQSTSTPAEQLDIPQLTNPDLEPVDISHLPPKSDRPITGNLHTNLSESQMGANIDPLTPTQSPSTGATNTNTGTGLNLDGLSEQIRNQTGNILEPLLEGDVVNRSIVKRVLPDFPENVQRNGYVTLTFTVVEDGSVRDVNISRTSGVVEFDNLSVNALRQWAFNRADRVHTGRITFNFVLN